MKTNFVNSLVKYFIEKNYFNLINSNAESLDFSGEAAALIRIYQGATVFLEIIDADRYEDEQLMRIMQNGAAMLENINGGNAYIFKLFLFDKEPGDEKLNIIENGQKDIIPDKKFLKGISVYISSKSVRKHFNEPAFDAYIVRSVKKFFSKGLEQKETSVEDIHKLLEKRKKDFEIQLKAKTPWVTYGLIAANVLVWLALRLLSLKTGETYGNLLVPYGAKVNSLIMEGQYWRFISAMFLHSNEVHLLLNCFSLYLLGTQVEKLFGHIKMTAVYFAAGLMGSVASFAFSPNASVGASGAIFGLMGAMLFFAIKRPSLMKSSFGANLVTILVVNLVYGFMNAGIDNSAHLGGLVGGFLTTGVVYASKEETSKDKILRIAALVLLAAVMLGGVYYSFGNEQNKYFNKIAELESYNGQSSYTEAETLAEQILSQNPKSASIKISVLSSLITAEYSQGKYNESEEHSEELLKMKINDDIKTQTLWNLCLAELSQGSAKFYEAEEHANLLIKLSPEHGHFMLGVIYYNTKDTNNLDKAKEELQKAKELNSPNIDAINNMLTNIEDMQNSK
ncbi:rhomboid protease GluP [Ruminiclostridium sufflavum DSM 19573]|uniref:Rhomboid protease GluP n=1 Tax=Ruminiclostridium sufflavum DSM 19573 TaxID=1121337 RepID=A0A318XKH6_9FIRM|nr:rhomboid family intramembrane serine protease [Ruminiclostridium sufflavum]PYG86873.1 rhomboid protease GluP [Ruminiclostridium sufflavum DSM 19573]